MADSLVFYAKARAFKVKVKAGQSQGQGQGLTSVVIAKQYAIGFARKVHA